jgi:hypothetical protein
MNIIRIAGPLTLWGALALLISGCGGSGDTRPRQPLSGEVSLDGHPLKKGQIVFEAKSKGEGVTAFGQIADGRFSIDREFGPVPGNYVVRIDSIDLLRLAAHAAGNSGQHKHPDRHVSTNLIPSQYNLDSTLTAEVKADASNSYTFKLSSNVATNTKGRVAFSSQHR